MTEPLIMTASAAAKPCELHKYHWPPVVETEGHHPIPIWMQKAALGRLQDDSVVWMCGTGHSNIHATIDFAIGRRSRYEPRKVTRLEQKFADMAITFAREHNVS